MTLAGGPTPAGPTVKSITTRLSRFPSVSGCGSLTSLSLKSDSTILSPVLRHGLTRPPA